MGVNDKMEATFHNGPQPSQPASEAQWWTYVGDWDLWRPDSEFPVVFGWEDNWDFPDRPYRDLTATQPGHARSYITVCQKPVLPEMEYRVLRRERVSRYYFRFRGIDPVEPIDVRVETIGFLPGSWFKSTKPEEFDAEAEARQHFGIIIREDGE